jgi:hypothetical protein
VGERLAAVLLALLVCAGPARAQEAGDLQAPDAAPAGQEETVADETVTEETATDEAEPESVRAEDVWESAYRGYQEVQTHTESEIEDGLRVSVGTAVLRPTRGYIPMQVTLHNQAPVPRAVRIGVDSNGVGRSEIASRQVEVGARQRLTVWVPVPIAARGGTVRVESPGLALRAYSFYSMDPVGQPVLVLGSEKAFQAGTRLTRVDNRPKLSVRFIGVEDAPRELAAYVGHAFVVVAGDATALPARSSCCALRGT